MFPLHDHFKVRIWFLSSQPTITVTLANNDPIFLAPRIGLAIDIHKIFKSQLLPTRTIPIDERRRPFLGFRRWFLGH